MDILINILITLMGAFVGAVFSVYIPQIIANRKYFRRKDLLGEWYSTYQSYYSTDLSSEWVNEIVVIDVHNGNLRLSNKDSSLTEDTYHGNAQLHNGQLSGNWVTARVSGGYEKGNFILTIIPAGGVMYGYFTAPRDTGETVYCAWVLSKSKAALNEGVKILNKQTVNITQPKD